MIGKHAGPLSTEDAPSLFLPSREPWYVPWHRADVSRNGAIRSTIQPKVK